MTLRPPTVKERILLYLLEVQKSTAAYVAPASATQEGLARATWIKIQHVAQYARPLVADGLLQVRTAHILHGKQRRKVYELTDSGQRLAFSLRDRLKDEVVLVREDAGMRQVTVRDALQRAHGKLSTLDILREFLLTGSVDLTVLHRPTTRATVRFLAEAPRIEEFVGRGRELALIAGPEARARVFVVLGVAGIGKSTLGAKVCSMLADDYDIFWHRVRAWDSPRSLLAEVAAFLAAAGHPGLKAAVEDREIPAALQVLRASLTELRVLFVLDDAHDANNELVAFLRSLPPIMAAAPDARLLVLTRRFVRFYDRRDVTLHGLIREIDLTGLNPEDIEPLLRPEAKGEIPAGIARHPLFLKLLRSAPGTDSRRALQTIEEFVHETIDSELSEGQRQIMKAAALFEVPVGPDALLSEPDASRRDVRGLVERALLLHAGEGLEVHDALRSFFASALTKADRSQLGQLVSDRLRALALRAEEEHDLPRARAYLFNALNVAPATADMGGLAEALADLQDRMGDLEGSAASYRRAVQAGESRSLPRLHRKLASIHTVQGNLIEASQEIERGFEALGDSGDGERGWLHLARCRLGIRRENELEESLDNVNAALSVFQASRDLRGQGQSLYQLAHLEIGRPEGSAEAAQRLLEEALEIGDRLGDPAFLATVHAELAFMFGYRLGEMEKASEHLGAVQSLIEPSEISERRASFLMLRGLLRQQTGDFRNAEADYHETIALSKKLRLHANRAYARSGLAEIDLHEGRIPEAQAALDAVVEEFREQGALSSVVDAACSAAECCLLQGDADGFRIRVTSLLDGAAESDLGSQSAQVDTLDAVRHFLDGEPEVAWAKLDAAIAHPDKFRPMEKWLPHFFLAQLLRAAGRSADAEVHRDLARSILHAFSRTAELSFLPERERLVSATLENAKIRASA